ncbi:hypothetical protein NIES39_Q02280 [Arthrospira platensis NIES-39]|nr:hypothetical protein NIES39_Q02280 [Arthrospira platensis NIES-39]
MGSTLVQPKYKPLFWGCVSLHPTYNCLCWVSLPYTQPTTAFVGFRCPTPNLQLPLLGFAALHPTYTSTGQTSCWVSLPYTQPTTAFVGFRCPTPNLQLPLLGCVSLHPTYNCLCWVSLPYTQPTPPPDRLLVGFRCPTPNLHLHRTDFLLGFAALHPTYTSTGQTSCWVSLPYTQPTPPPDRLLVGFRCPTPNLHLHRTDFLLGFAALHPTYTSTGQTSCWVSLPYTQPTPPPDRLLVGFRCPTPNLHLHRTDFLLGFAALHPTYTSTGQTSCWVSLPYTQPTPPPDRLLVGFRCPTPNLHLKSEVLYMFISNLVY